VEVKPKIEGPFVTLNGKVKAIYSNWGYNNPLYAGSNAKVSSLWPKIDKKYIETQVGTFVQFGYLWVHLGAALDFIATVVGGVGVSKD
jgi:hypothetical protein